MALDQINTEKMWDSSYNGTFDLKNVLNLLETKQPTETETHTETKTSTETQQNPEKEKTVEEEFSTLFDKIMNINPKYLSYSDNNEKTYLWVTNGDEPGEKCIISESENSEWVISQWRLIKWNDGRLRFDIMERSADSDERTTVNSTPNPSEGIINLYNKFLKDCLTKNDRIENLLIWRYPVEVDKEEQKIYLKIDDVTSIRIEYVDGKFNFYENTEWLLTEQEYWDINLQWHEMLQWGEWLANVNILNKIIKLYDNNLCLEQYPLKKIANLFMELELAALEKQFDREVSQVTGMIWKDLSTSQDEIKNKYNIK